SQKWRNGAEGTESSDSEAALEAALVKYSDQTINHSGFNIMDLQIRHNIISIGPKACHPSILNPSEIPWKIIDEHMMILMQGDYDLLQYITNSILMNPLLALGRSNIESI
ncbi:hypothetical protein ACJX0J_009605, partial [Zea mays]